MTQTEDFKTKKYLADLHKEQMIEIKKMNEQELIRKWYELLENLPSQSSEEYYKEQIATIKVRLVNIPDKSFSKKSKKALEDEINRYKNEFKSKSKQGLVLYLHKVGSKNCSHAAFIKMKNQLKKFTFGLSFRHKIIIDAYACEEMDVFKYFKNEITEIEDESFTLAEFNVTLAEFKDVFINPIILAEFFENELKRLEEIIEVNYVVLVNFFEQLKKRIDKKFDLVSH